MKEVGGLHVVGSERHESRRIDNQLRGRAARQGDPGSSQFYLSLEDELMRRFAGQNVSDLMQRLKIDDTVPIQAGLVNRTIEQAQSRVEGYNFDVRKHLLEYDDVLNTQRNRIYGQRDRIFIKEDVTDDFLEMMEAEVNQRVDAAGADSEGRWKLLAWLEEAQPSLPVDPETIYPSYLLEILLRDLEDEADKPTALLALARQALETERAHLLDAVETQADQVEERLEAQVKSKRAEVELALEGLENEAQETGKDVDPRAATQVVSEVLGVNFSLSANEQKNFDYARFKKELGRLAESATAARMRAGLVGTVERRLGAPLGLPREFKADEDWDVVRKQLVEAAEQSHRTKAERSLGEIERELKQHLPANPTRDQLSRALISMAIGSVTGFDQKTHRKVSMRTQRLNYFHVAGEMVSDWTVADLKQEIRDHLRGALEALHQMWGEAEFRRLGGLRAAETPASLRAALEAEPEVAAALSAANTLGELPAEARPAARRALGRATVNQLLRQIMLQVIGNLWVDYLTSVEALRTSVGLEAYAQRDPLVAYKSRAYDMFQELLVNMRAGVVVRAFTYRPRTDAPAAGRTAAPAAAAAPAIPGNGGAPATRPPEAANLGRNERCWCGSGKKYKDCHWDADHAAEQAPVGAAAAPATGGGKRRRRRH